MLTDKELKLIQKLYLLLGTEFTITDVVQHGEVYAEYRRDHTVRHLVTLFTHHPSCEVIHGPRTIYKFKDYPC